MPESIDVKNQRSKKKWMLVRYGRMNHIGLFEPVGTQLSFQNQGLGRAIVAEGLRKLRAWGMEKAMVCVEHDNQAAIHLYQAIGFRPVHKLHTFVKAIDG